MTLVHMFTSRKALNDLSRKSTSIQQSTAVQWEGIIHDTGLGNGFKDTSNGHTEIQRKVKL